MKFVLAMAEEDQWPHILRDDHIEKVRAVDTDVEVVVARGEAAINKELKDADAVAGFPMRLLDIPTDKNIKWIHSFSAGVDKILTPNVKESKDIVVSNSSGIHAVPIAEHLIAFMLTHTRSFMHAFSMHKGKTWNRPERPSELRGKTVVVVGMGAIGSETARLVHALGTTVYGVVRTKRNAPEYVEALVTNDELDAILSKADFVVITLPGGPQTEGMFNKDLFSKMKPSAVIMNIGRGTIINQEDLIEALEEDTLGAAYLDVTTPEPLPEDHPLWSTKNVFITPHYSGLSEKYLDRAIDQLCVNLKAFREGTSLPNQVDKELGY